MHDDIRDRLFGERELRAGLRQRRASHEHAVGRGFGLCPRLVRERLRHEATSQKCSVPLGRRLGERVLRFGQLQVCFGARLRRARIGEPQVGVHALNPNQDRALRDVLADIHGRRSDATRALRRHIGGLIGLKAAGRLDDHGFVHALDRGDRNGRG